MITTKRKDLFKIPNYSGCGVYAIVNAEDFKCYVGISRNISKRAKSHLQALKSGKHPNLNLQKDANKNLRFVILHRFDDISKEHLKIAEKVYMICMMRNDFGLYNISPSTAKTVNDLSYCVVCDIMSILKPHEHIDNSIQAEYGVKTGYLHCRKPQNRNSY